MPTPFQQGYAANSAYENPYWINYPVKKGISEQEQYAAAIWIDGYVQKIIDSNRKN